MIGRRRQIDSSAVLYRSFCRKNPVPHGKIAFLNRQETIHIGQIEPPISHRNLSQTAAVQIDIERYFGIVHRAANEHSAIHRAAHMAHRQLEEPKRFFHAPSIETEPPAHRSGLGVDETAPAETPVSLAEVSISDTEHLIFIGDAGRDLLDLRAIDGDLPAGHLPVKYGRSDRAGNMAAESDPSFGRSRPQYPFDIHIDQGRFQVQRLFRHRAA